MVVDDKNGAGDTISKADFDALQSKYDSLSQEHEILRAEIFTPEYIKFASGGGDIDDEKDKGKDADKDKGNKGGEEDKDGDIDLSKMTRKELIDLIENKSNEKAAAVRKEIADRDMENSRNEVKAFAATHADFDKLRPIMYGLSIDPKHKNASLDTLYNEAKKIIEAEASALVEAKSKKSRGFMNERPGGNSGSHEKDKNLSADEAAWSALDEVKSTLGDIPHA